jgi:hypothetical protein
MRQEGDVWQFVLTHARIVPTMASTHHGKGCFPPDCWPR